MRGTFGAIKDNAFSRTRVSSSRGHDMPDGTILCAKHSASPVFGFHLMQFGTMHEGLNILERPQKPYREV